MNAECRKCEHHAVDAENSTKFKQFCLVNKIVFDVGAGKDVIYKQCQDCNPGGNCKKFKPKESS